MVRNEERIKHLLKARRVGMLNDLQAIEKIKKIKASSNFSKEDSAEVTRGLDSAKKGYKAEYGRHPNASEKITMHLEITCEVFLSKLREKARKYKEMEDKAREEEERKREEEKRINEEKAGTGIAAILPSPPVAGPIPTASVPIISTPVAVPVVTVPLVSPPGGLAPVPPVLVPGPAGPSLLGPYIPPSPSLSVAVSRYPVAFQSVSPVITSTSKSSTAIASGKRTLVAIPTTSVPQPTSSVTKRTQPAPPGIERVKSTAPTTVVQSQASTPSTIVITPTETSPAKKSQTVTDPTPMKESQPPAEGIPDKESHPNDSSQPAVSETSISQPVESESTTPASEQVTTPPDEPIPSSATTIPTADSTQPTETAITPSAETTAPSEETPSTKEKTTLEETPAVEVKTSDPAPNTEPESVPAEVTEPEPIVIAPVTVIPPPDVSATQDVASPGPSPSLADSLAQIESDLNESKKRKREEQSVDAAEMSSIPDAQQESSTPAQEGEPSEKKGRWEYMYDEVKKKNTYVFFPDPTIPLLTEEEKDQSKSERLVNRPKARSYPTKGKPTLRLRSSDSQSKSAAESEGGDPPESQDPESKDAEAAVSMETRSRDPETQSHDPEDVIDLSMLDDSDLVVMDSVGTVDE